MMQGDQQVSCNKQRLKGGKGQIGEIIKGVLEIEAAKRPKQRKFHVLSEKNT